MIKDKVMGMLGIGTKAGKVISGMDACIEAIQKHKVSLILVAQEASDKTKKNIQFYCEKFKIPIYVYGQIEQLSEAIGKKNKAIIGVKEPNIAKQIEKIINGGEFIG